MSGIRGPWGQWSDKAELQKRRQEETNVTEEEMFGRQPLPVEVHVTGKDSRDVLYWVRELKRRAEFKGDLVEDRGSCGFVIFPRAVND